MRLFGRRAVQVAIAGLALLLILGGFAYGYSKASATARSVSLSDVRLTSLNLLPDGSAVMLGLNASVSNPTNEPVTLSGVRYEVLLNGTKLGSVSGSPLSLGPRASEQVRIALNVSDEKALKAIADALSGSESNLSVRLVASMPAKWYGVVRYSTIPVTAGFTARINLSNVVLSLRSSSEPGMLMASSGGEVTLLPFEVTDTEWFVNGKRVNVVQDGTEVMLHTTIRLTRDVSNFPLAVCVVSDYGKGVDISFPNNYVACNTELKSLSGHAGDTFVVDIKFKATLTSAQAGLGKRGYYVAYGYRYHDIINDERPQYTTPNAYPPRLRVTWGDAPFYVENVTWTVDGVRTNSYSIANNTGATVKVYVTVVATESTDKEADLRLVVRADLEHASDKEVASSVTKTELVSGHKYVLTASFSIKQLEDEGVLSSKDLERLRGFFVKVKSYALSYMSRLPDTFPPRLRVTRAPYELVSVSWIQDGFNVSKVASGAKVDAIVRFRVLEPFDTSYLVVCVKKDISAWFDPTIKCVDKVLDNGKPGEEIVVDVPFTENDVFKGFTAPATDAGAVRGYYITYKVYRYTRGKLMYEWEMPDEYPPRLMLYRPYKLDSVKWYVNGHEPYKNSANFGAHVKLEVTLKVETILDHGIIEFCVMEDLSLHKDKELKCSYYEIHDVLAPGSTITVATYFTAEKEPHLRSYYTKIESKDYGLSETYEDCLVPEYWAPNLYVEEPDFSITKVEWVANGGSISDVVSGTWVDAKVTVKAGKTDVNSLPLTFCVRKDLAGRKDENVKCVTKEITLMKGQEYTATISFQAHEEKHLRGYFIQVTSSKYSDKSWHQEGKYPPRLKLKPQEYVVSNVQWLVNGKSVHKVVENQIVTAKVTIATSTGLYEVPVKICVRADKAGLPDKDVTCTTKTLTIPRGGSKTVTITFQAKHYARLRGYFIEVKSDLPDFSWHQESKYPPRLRYVSPSFRVVEVVWLPNDPMASPVTEVNKDTWVYARITIHTDTGLANAPITFCVKEDRAHGSDKDKACVTKFISLPAGGEYSVLIHFKATYYKKFFVYTRGYFVTVKSDDPHYHWEMSNHYPPRLKVKN